jgi:hypothetical protein
MRLPSLSFLDRTKRFQAWSRRTGLVAGCLLACLGAALPAQGPPTAGTPSGMSEDQEAAFLLHAKVIASTKEQTGKTGAYHVTLSDGKLTHDGSFQPIDERKNMMQFADGRAEINFRDSYHFNIAGYQLAKLLGLDDMVPVYVERSWDGKTGSMSWRIENVLMDEHERYTKHIPVPDPGAWNKQIDKIRVFNELIYNTDPNMTNILITKDWKIWMIDFTRAFRTFKQLQDARNLVMCDRQLFEKLKQLDENQVLQATKGQLSKSEVKALMARRDKIVALFNEQIASKGEGAVLY